MRANSDNYFFLQSREALRSRGLSQKNVARQWPSDIHYVSSPRVVCVTHDKVKACYGRRFNHFLSSKLSLGLAGLLNHSRTAAPFWGRTTQLFSSFSPGRDCSLKRGKPISLECHRQYLVVVCYVFVRYAGFGIFSSVARVPFLEIVFSE